MKRPFGLVLGIAILVVLLWRFGIHDLAQAFTHLRPGYLLIYIALAGVVLIGYSLRWRLVARAVGHRPPLARLIAARLAGDAVGALVPSGKLAGEPVRIALLRANGIAGAEAGASVTIDRLIEMMGNMVCVAAYAGVFWLTRGAHVPERAPLLLVAGVMAGLFSLGVPLVLWREGRRPVALLYRSSTLRALPRLGPWLSALELTEDRLIGFMRGHPEKVLIGLLASLAIELLIVVEYHFLLASFDVSIDLPTLLLVLLGTGAARFAPTPAGLGALEAAQVGAIALAGGRPETGLVVGVVLRLHETLWMLVGLIALYAQGTTLGRLRASASADRAVA